MEFSAVTLKLLYGHGYYYYSLLFLWEKWLLLSYYFVEGEAVGFIGSNIRTLNGQNCADESLNNIHPSSSLGLIHLESGIDRTFSNKKPVVVLRPGTVID